MTEEVMTNQPPRQAAAGKVLFWLAIPIVLASGLGAMIHHYVPIISGLAAALIFYALGTFIVLWKFPRKWVRVPVLFLNLALFIAFGWVQMGSFFSAYPWTRYLGAILIGILWVVVAFGLLQKLGKKARHSNPPGGTYRANDQRSLVDRIDQGDVDVKERIIAALKLAGNKGDMTVDAAAILEKMALASEGNYINAKANGAQAIIAFYQCGLMPEVLEANAINEIATLLNISQEKAEEMLEGEDEKQQEERDQTWNTILSKMKWT